MLYGFLIVVENGEHYFTRNPDVEFIQSTLKICCTFNWKKIFKSSTLVNELFDQDKKWGALGESEMDISEADSQKVIEELSSQSGRTFKVYGEFTFC